MLFYILIISAEKKKRMRSEAFAKQRYSDQYCCLEAFLLLEGNNRKKVLVSFWCSPTSVMDCPLEMAMLCLSCPNLESQLLRLSCLLSYTGLQYKCCLCDGWAEMGDSLGSWDTWNFKASISITPIMVQFWQHKGRAKDLGLPSEAHGTALGDSLKFTLFSQSVTDTEWAKTRQCGLILVRDCQNGDVPVVEHPPIYSWAANGSSLVFFCQGMHSLWKYREK